MLINDFINAVFHLASSHSLEGINRGRGWHHQGDQQMLQVDPRINKQRLRTMVRNDSAHFLAKQFSLIKNLKRRHLKMQSTPLIFLEPFDCFLILYKWRCTMYTISWENFISNIGCGLIYRRQNLERLSSRRKNNP